MEPARSPRHGGFTLIEVLIATTLLAVMMLLLTGSLRMGAQSWDNGEEKLAASSRMFVAQNFLRGHLAAMLPVAGAAQPGKLALAFRGTRDSLEYVAPLPTQVKRGGLFQFSLFTKREGDHSDLHLAVMPYAPNPKFGERIEPLDDVVLVENVGETRFSYLPQNMNQFQQSEVRWLDEWEQPQVPALIRLEIQPAEGPAWTPMIIAPRIQALR